MHALVLSASLLAATQAPSVATSGALWDAARQVEAPIAEVTVYSDRARIRRRATLELAPGVHAIRLPDLPGGALQSSVRLRTEGARVVRVETVPTARERIARLEDEKAWQKLIKSIGGH